MGSEEYYLLMAVLGCGAEEIEDIKELWKKAERFGVDMFEVSKRIGEEMKRVPELGHKIVIRMIKEAIINDLIEILAEEKADEFIFRYLTFHAPWHIDDKEFGVWEIDSSETKKEAVKKLLKRYGENYIG